MPHSVPCERAAKQLSYSADMPSSTLSGTVPKKRSSSPAVVSGRVRKSSSAAAHQTTITNGVRAEEYARTVFSAEENVDGRQDVKAEDVMMNDAFSDETIQDMTMNILSNYQFLCQAPTGTVSEFDPSPDSSWQESLSSNLSVSETEPFPQNSSTRPLGTYRKPLPPPAFPFSRYEGWCLREKRKIYRKRKFNEISKEKDPVDRLIHWDLEKTPNNRKKLRREFSLYLQKLDMILTTTKYLFDSYEVCKERAKALQHEPVNSSPLREHICSAEGDEWQVAEEIDDFFEQWLTQYEELYQPEEMNWELGVQQSVSNFVENSTDWESDMLPLVSFDQLLTDGGTVGPWVQPAWPGTTENGNGEHLEDILGDLILPDLAILKSSTG